MDDESEGATPGRRLKLEARQLAVQQQATGTLSRGQFAAGYGLPAEASAPPAHELLRQAAEGFRRRATELDELADLASSLAPDSPAAAALARVAGEAHRDLRRMERM
jgi:hypothetical protein